MNKCLLKKFAQSIVKGKVTHSHELHTQQQPLCGAMQKDPQTKDENQEKYPENQQRYPEKNPRFHGDWTTSAAAIPS